MGTERTNTSVVQTRVDIRVLAGLAQYAADQGRSPKSVSEFSKSSLVRTSLELLHDSLQIQGILKPFETSADALGLLMELGYKMENSVNKEMIKAAIDGESYQDIKKESFQAVELLNKSTSPGQASDVLAGSD